MTLTRIACTRVWRIPATKPSTRANLEVQSIVYKIVRAQDPRRKLTAPIINKRAVFGNIFLNVSTTSGESSGSPEPASQFAGSLLICLHLVQRISNQGTRYGQRSETKADTTVRNATR